MSVRVVTDSTSDLPGDLTVALNITVVPLNVHFGGSVYRDGVDMTGDEFYQRLESAPVVPTTTQPSPAQFLEAYERLAKETDEIVCVLLAPQLSGTFNSAELAKSMAPPGLRIELVDTRTISMAEGLTVLAAARAAAAGASLDEVMAVARDTLERVRLLAVLDTLEYLRRGGRIGRAQALLGSLLNFKPVITVENGEVHPAGRVRTRGRVIEHLFDFISGFSRIEEMGVLYSTGREDALSFAERVRGRCPADCIHLAQIGPVVGTHAGPSALGVAVLLAK